MSVEAPKAVEAPLVAQHEAPVAPVESTPAVTETTPLATAPEPTTETPVVAEPVTEATEAAPVKEEVKPVEEGILGYKGPGLLKSFIFQKKFFYFGSEPVQSKTLSSYLRGEKSQDSANKNVAWASHTGKGLLFFVKKANEKATPAGIFNLSEVENVTEEGTTDFHFTLAGHKHTFQAATLGDRDNWVSVLKTKVAEAKELAPTVVESEQYKKEHSSLVKPVVAAASLPKKSVDKKEEKAEEKAEKKEIKEEKKEEKAEAKEEKKEEKAEEKAEKKEIKEEKKEEKAVRKDRSASRKRNSIFGNFGLGKKEEKLDTPKETSAAPVVAAPAVEEPAVVAPEHAVAPEVAAPVSAVDAPVTEAPVTEKPVPTKRNSIFGTLQSRFSQSKERKPEHEVAPAVPSKEAEPVSENAPIIPAVDTTEPLSTSVASPATVPTETTELPTTNGETKAAETPVVKTDKRKSSLPWMTKKEKAVSSDEETEKPKSPFAKLRATVKGKSSPKAEKVTEEKAVEPIAATEVAEPTPAATEPVVSEPTPIVPQTTSHVTASA